MEACDSIIRVDCLGPVIYYGHCSKTMSSNTGDVYNDVANIKTLKNHRCTKIITIDQTLQE